MFEDYKLKKHFRSLQKGPDSDQFLATLKTDLEKYIEINPIHEDIFKQKKKGIFNFDFKGALREKMRDFPFGNLKTNPKFARLVIYSFVFVFLSGGVAMASEQSLPGDSLYPIKLLAEDIRYSVSFTADSKAKLHASFAARRVSEIRTLLEKKGVEPAGLDQAISRLQYNTSSAAQALKSQKNEAKANELARSINETFNDQKKELKETFKKEEEHLRSHEREIKEQIRQAKKTGNENDLQTLSVRLEGVKNERKAVVSKKNETFEAIKDEKEEIKNQMHETERADEDKKEISEDIAELLKEKTEYFDKAAEKGLDSQGKQVFELFDVFIGKAREAFQKGEYADAKIFLDSAQIELEKAIGKVEDIMEKMDSGEYEIESENKNDGRKELMEAGKAEVSASGTYESKKSD